MLFFVQVLLIAWISTLKWGNDVKHRTCNLMPKLKRISNGSKTAVCVSTLYKCLYSLNQMKVPIKTVILNVNMHTHICTYNMTGNSKQDLSILRQRSLNLIFNIDNNNVGHFHRDIFFHPLQNV